MKNLFEASTVQEVRHRILQLQPDSPRQWGTMNVAQAVAHCSAGVQMSLGEILPPRAFVGRIFGRIIKPLALGNEEPMRRNTPTMKELLMPAKLDLATEQEKLCTLIDRFAAAGPGGCTRHPHAFFGRLNPQEWAILMYKHLDHHLRQFAV